MKGTLAVCNEKEGDRGGVVYGEFDVFGDSEYVGSVNYRYSKDYQQRVGWVNFSDVNFSLYYGNGEPRNGVLNGEFLDLKDGDFNYIGKEVNKRGTRVDLAERLMKIAEGIKVHKENEGDLYRNTHGKKLEECFKDLLERSGKFFKSAEGCTDYEKDTNDYWAEGF